MLQKNLAPGLLRGALGASGSDFRVTGAGANAGAQVALLVVQYRDKKTAADRATSTAALGGYFRRTKILTRFSCAAAGSDLVVAFTESSGNADLVRLVERLPRLVASARDAGSTPDCAGKPDRREP
ncbi:MAG: hypothetical protein JNJ60_20830 [Rhodocyclaceae bacterium]|nr:hypothetical protein [Rhodocyclaceae bacterium]